MPRPRQATGRPSTPVIPDGWETAHADTATAAMRGRVSLTNPAGATEPTWVNNQWTAPTASPYATQVPARVQRLTGDARDIVTAEDPETVVDHLVQIPWGLDSVRPGHLVTVATATDPLLVGVVLRVHHVAAGTERFTRDLYCTHT